MTRRASPRASSSCSATARPSCASTRPSPPTRTSTSPPRRFAAASSSPATASPGRCARRGAPSATRRWCASTRSTAHPPTRSPTARATRICPVDYPSERLALGSEDPTLEAIEWLTPLGRGSRAVIVGARDAGKTETLRRLLAVLSGREDLDAQPRARRRPARGDRASGRRARWRPPRRSASPPRPTHRARRSSARSTPPSASPRAAATRSC